MFGIAFLVSGIIVGLWHRRLAKKQPQSPTLVMRLALHWFLFLLFFVVCLIIYGGIGLSFGVPKLFRDDYAIYAQGLLTLSNWPAITPLLNSPLVTSLAAATIMLAIVWTFIGLTECADAKPDKLPGESAHRRFVAEHGMPFVLFLLAAVLFPRVDELAHGWREVLLALLGVGSGYLLAILLIGIAYRLAPRLNRWRWVRRLVSWFACHTRYGKRGDRDLTDTDRNIHGAFLMFALVQLLLLGFVTISRIIIPPLAILMLIGWVTLLYFIFTWLRPVPRWFAVLLLLAVIMFGNSRPYKYTFPGFEASRGQSAYAVEQRIQLDVQTGDASPAELIASIQALAAWRANAALGSPRQKPKLVVVATEGGAYRAAFWTAVVLDNLEALSHEDEALRGFTTGIRLITGASGGMVGAAYYAALRSDTAEQTPSVVEQLTHDIAASRRGGTHSTSFPIPGDTLSPIAQQLVQRDIFNIFRPTPVAMDRGRVLESHWLTLNVSFAELAAGEKAGWRPSLLLTPTLVETGQQLAITNMDLAGLDGRQFNEVEEFFSLFGDWHETFTLATAVRMNASFPYVSPAVALPAEPSRRVMDAGYFDNYGVYSATAWLGQQQVAGWINKNTSGVIVVQIRAFPPREPQAGWLGPAFQWLTSPLEALITAREATNIHSNNEALRRLQETVAEVPVDTVVFSNAASPASVAKSWYINEDEITETRKQFDSESNRAALACLMTIWTSNPRRTIRNANNQGGGSDVCPH